MAGREEGRGAGPVALAKIMSISWKAIRHRAEWFLVKLAAFLIPLCPRRLIVWIGSAIGSIAAGGGSGRGGVAGGYVRLELGGRTRASRGRGPCRHTVRHFCPATSRLFF